MGWISKIAMSALVICVLCIAVTAQPQISVTGQGSAFAGQIVPLEVTIPADGFSTVECTLSLEDDQIQIQSLPEAQGWDVEFKSMTLILTRQEGESGQIRLHMKFKILSVPAQTKIRVSFSVTGEQTVALGEMTYEITVVEPPSHENFLTELSVAGGTLSPQFHRDVLQYSATVSADCRKPQIYAVGAQKSRVEVSQTEFSKAQTCVVTVVVTAENGSQRNYTIHVTREELPETTMETISETARPSQPGAQNTEQSNQTSNDVPTAPKKDGAPGWLVAAAVMAGVALGGAGGIMLSKTKKKGCQG